MSASASLAAAAAPPLGRCRMNGSMGPEPSRAPVPLAWERPSHNCLLGLQLAQKEGRGAGGSPGPKAECDEGGGEMTGWSRVSPYALHM